jgi:hypothetical protein
MGKPRHSVGYSAAFVSKKEKKNEEKKEQKNKFKVKEKKEITNKKGLHLYKKLTHKTSRSKVTENNPSKSMTITKPVTPKNNKSSTKSYQIISKTSAQKTPKFKKFGNKTPIIDNSKNEESQLTPKNSTKLSEKPKYIPKVTQPSILSQIEDDPTPKTLPPPLKTPNSTEKPEENLSEPKESPSEPINHLSDPNKSLNFSDHLNSEKLSDIVEPPETSKNQKFIDIVDNQINDQDSFAQPKKITDTQSFGNLAGEVLQQQLEESRRQNEYLKMQNVQLQSQTHRYEEMLSKMNHEYEKLFVHSTNTDKDILSLKNELSNNSLASEKTINSLKGQLKVTLIFIL